MKRKPILTGLALLVFFLLMAPLLVPMESYLKQMEKISSDQLGAPVSIKAVHLALLPSPRVNIKGISIGADSEIQVAGVSAVLDVTTLFNAVRVVSRLDIDQPAIKRAAIDLLSPLMSQKNEAAAVAIRRIVISQAKLEWPGLMLPTMNVELKMSDAGQLQQGTIRSADDTLAIDLKPQGNGYHAAVTARQWIPPIGPPIRLDTFSAQLEYAESTLDVPSIEAVLYGGKLHASTHLDWKKNWQLKGKLKTEAIELGDVSKLFTKGISISGRISGTGTFGSTAKQSGQLVDNLLLDYAFDVAKGTLHGMDLAKAASLFVKQTGHGGETEFDRLSGKVHTVGKQIELRDMDVVSGLLAARGQVKIAPAKTLDGHVDVELKKGLALVTVPLKVSGTLDAPEVMPTKAAIAGAAAGTAVLGPMGTSIGMKAGSALDKLFGGKK